MSSVFTQIIQGAIPSHRIYEDDKCIVILDIHPVQPGHSLVIPKEEIVYVWDVDDELYQHLWKIAKKIAKNQLEVLGTERVSIIVDGEQVPHAHIQLIPTNSAHDLHATPPTEPDHDSLRAMAQRLRIN